ncbi:hypothetical protein EZ428_15150 [Pedobacter frigiditerrae]|uniref:MBL fold metallo-hydrolase n=1 Tax=Pedobacter frigiditerrae TaxID=2530452 RepID=A0A4R0MU23_9SPHI|nr:MBL fold metallo-hydrolase [Pedobacter frigiditerrae]TCC90601.1 hypothetical protein EZ428_15150 [Pedobacter frigiditerrae]
MIRIDYLNHASVLIEIENIKLLTDPWYFGTCFQNGWGLRYDNNKAIEIASNATHLWISHFHSDHFHILTLKKILEINPDIVVIGNYSYNFQLNNVMESLGFKKIIPFAERKEYYLNKNIKIIRYPTTGIDNMLLIQSVYGNILNYNDCNLPSLSRKLLSKRIKSVDIILTNFNHAGKLLVYPKKDDAEIKTKLKKNFKNNFLFFDVKYIFPFASYHYYKAPESFDQNSSMLRSDELLDLDTRILDVKIGDSLVYSKKDDLIAINKAEILENELKVLFRETKYQYEDIEEASKAYCKTLRSNYWIFTKLLPNFYIEIVDLKVIVNLDAQRGILQTDKKHNIVPHIKVQSESIYHWFSTAYGTDNFIVGAHFEIANKNKIPLKWQIIFGILIDNKLSVKSIFKMLFSYKGIQFLINRREEIIGIILERKVNADYHD